MKCVVITVTYMVELQDRVLAPQGPSSIAAVAELVLELQTFWLLSCCSSVLTTAILSSLALLTTKVWPYLTMISSDSALIIHS